MIDFSGVTAVEIPDGVVTQIADASGNVLWALSNEPVVLEVAKITSDTYASSTTYTGEEFILLDIYPKAANSTVKVTYGNLTKTLTFSGTNAQQVYFGTFNGVSDEVETPASGTLTIEGGYKGFGVGTFAKSSKSSTNYCNCITDVTDWGAVAEIPTYAFYNCSNLTLTELPSGITSIGNYAFYGCTALTLTELPSGITSIGDSAFRDCTGLTSITIPETVTSISSYAFYGCTGLTSITISEGVTSIESWAFGLKFASSTFDRGTIVLPSTIQNIDETAFMHESSTVSDTYYWNYKNIVILATTPPVFTAYSLGIEVPNKITVPAGCGDTYKAASGWSKYADIIVEAS